MPSIIVLEGKNRGHRFPFEERAILGRGKVDIRISDTAASRQHARIYRNGDRYFVVDLQSSNGTQINDRKITNQEIRAGDTIRIGSTLLRFETEVAAAPQKPAAPPPVVRPRAPEPAPATPPRDGEEPVVATIESRDDVLQYSQHVGSRSSFLSQDFAQRGIGFQALIVILFVLLGAGLVYGAYWLTASS